MARIRTIKPEFFTNSKITKLTPLARLFYVSLWCEADRLGRMKWDADTLKDRYFPKDKCDIDEIGKILAASKLIRFYRVAEQLYIDIPGFLEHQVINNREGESAIPPFTDDACVTRESGDTDAACGKEGRKGREGRNSPIAPKGGVVFEAFWEAYPEKVGKKAALKAWENAQDKPDLDALLQALERYKRAKPADRAWKNPATWLNQGCWADAHAALAANDVQIVDRETSLWVVRLAGWRKSRSWMRDLWGPTPEETGCTVPKRLLENADTALRNLTMAG